LCGAEQLVLGSPKRARRDGPLQIAIDVGQEPLEIADMRLDLLRDRRTCSRQTLLLGDEHVHNLAAPREVSLEVTRSFVRKRPYFGAKPLRKQGQHGSIDP